MKETAGGGSCSHLELCDQAALRVSSGWISSKLFCMPHYSPIKLRAITILISWPVKVKPGKVSELFSIGDPEQNTCYHGCHHLYYDI